MLSKASTQHHKNNIMKYLFAIIITLGCFLNAHAESKRIEVYSNGLSYWDVQQGDTLSEIIAQALPNSPRRRHSLLNDIVQLNPAAFIQNNPDLLKAGVRLWLPGHGSNLIKQINKNNTRKFSWGYIHSLK